jgi:hypothetical protein
MASAQAFRVADWRPLSEQVLSPPRFMLGGRNDPLRKPAVQILCVARFLFDHLVGAYQQPSRKFDPECLRRFEVEGQLDFYGLPRPVCRLVSQRALTRGTAPIVKELQAAGACSLEPSQPV